jgi:DNA adenine methylase
MPQTALRRSQPKVQIPLFAFEPIQKRVEEKTTLTPPLKWAGGKRWLVPTLLKIWEPFSNRRLVEPFCGGLGVALGLRPTNALLNDFNPHLINFYKQLQQGLEITLELKNDVTAFGENRDRFNELIRTGNFQTPEAAQLFYYLNRTCFNGLCRFNRSGEFNVPFGRYKTINYVKEFYSYRSVLKEWTFTQGDFEKIPVEPDDFIYADPPYDVDFTSYSAGGFSWEAQVRAAEWLSRHNGPVVLSNQATERIIKLYGDLGFHLEYFDAPRRISCTGDRSAAREVLATKGLE